MLWESFKNLCFAEKEINLKVFENWQFPPTSTTYRALTIIIINRVHLRKKIAWSIIFHMPPWRSMYLFWVLSNSSFHAGKFWTISAQSGLNWILRSLQTAKPSTTKKNIVVNVIKMFGQNSSSSFDMMMSTHGVRQSWKRYLDDGNMPRFFHHWRFLRKLQLWLIMVDFLRYCAYMLYTPKSLYDLHKYFRTSSKKNYNMKKLCKWAMT